MLGRLAGQSLVMTTNDPEYPLNRIDPDGHRWFYRKVENTLQVVWVNPNDDGSYTSPEGDGWQAFIPTEGRRYFMVGAEDGRKVMKRNRL